jgi:hypothetical protein
LYIDPESGELSQAETPYAVTAVDDSGVLCGWQGHNDLEQHY